MFPMPLPSDEDILSRVKAVIKRIPKRSWGLILPALTVDAGKQAGKQLIEFFTAILRNPNRRRAYTQAMAEISSRLVRGTWAPARRHRAGAYCCLWRQQVIQGIIYA
jgi:hypothetical protein